MRRIPIPFAVPAALAAVLLACASHRAEAPAPAAAPQAVAEVPQKPAHDPDVIFVPTPEPVVKRMLDLANVGPNDVVYDLGCGDGRIVVAAARRGARAVGIDIDPQRVREARAAVEAAGVGDRATIIQGDLFEMDLSPATVVTLYLLPELNLRIRPKILALPAGTRVVSHAFDMGDWEPDRKEEVEGRAVFFWTVPAGGQARSAAAGAK